MLGHIDTHEILPSPNETTTAFQVVMLTSGGPYRSKFNGVAAALYDHKLLMLYISRLRIQSVSMYNTLRQHITATLCFTYHDVLRTYVLSKVGRHCPHMI
ncbi:uncharacterized protein PHALS_14886 [Plasmopara halstedii]|uniref:Uncharacterized protein n=1 Tax=Plasmopara halstedii TaxID=4781 RepID=A0A0P1AWQ4_PLAHL|nr:uncharacterized protein PHALS_14886 [Plasmopara halstedii]CEG46249.1 hypothetical protein PHALS_14886 [Plasmopara halstedii]|eukprot:XP_024582618.1 hypothetical protein PHALS_14886 [Plasmopara halstedii]